MGFSMNLYEINEQLLELIEAREYAEDSLELEEAITELKMIRGDKIENIALYIKSLKADSEAIKAEEKKLAERRKAVDNKADRLQNYLQAMLNGDKFSTARCVVSYRKSVSVDVPNVDDIPLSFQRVEKKISADKTAIKKAIQAGENVHGASLIEKQNIVIK
jgi:hypothetical protein